MRYRLNGRLTALKENEQPAEGEAYVEVLSKEQYIAQQSGHVQDQILLQSLENARHCKADIFKRYLLGTLRVPDKKNIRDGEWTCGYSLDGHRLLFVGSTEQVHRVLRGIERIRAVEITTPALALFEFLESLIAADAEFIDDYEENLEDRETDMSTNVHEIPKGFEQYLLQTRRELTVLGRFYKQLSQMGEVLHDFPGEMVSNEARELFALFGAQAEHLEADVNALREYTLQIRDLYQARIDMRHNHIGQILTILSSVFLPLTLLTGWYGMNFHNMPELAYESGYFVVIAIAVIVIAAELIFFKIKKWL